MADPLTTAEILANLRESVNRLERRLRPAIERLADEREALLYDLLAKELTTPWPALGIAELVKADGKVVPRGSTLLPAYTDAGNTQVIWRTVYSVEPWELRVTKAEILSLPHPEVPAAPRPAKAAVRLRLAPITAPDGAAARTQPGRDRLILHLAGPERLAFPLFEALTRTAVFAAARPLPSGDLRPVQLRPVGLEPHEELLPPPPLMPHGIRLLSELLVFPTKFLFVEIAGLSALAREAERGFEVVVFLSGDAPALEELSAEHVRPNCTPVVNLFVSTQPPLDLGPAEFEVPLRPLAGMAVFSVDGVQEFDPAAGRWADLPPAATVAGGAGWRYRHCVPRNGCRPDVVLTLPEPQLPPPSVRPVRLDLTCCNWEEATAPAGRVLEAEDGSARFRLLGAAAGPIAPLQGNLARWMAGTRRVLLATWSGEATDLRPLLEQAALLGAAAPATVWPAEEERQRRVRAMLEGIRPTQVAAATCDQPAIGAEPGGLWRGRDVAVEFDADLFPGRSPWVHAIILDRFLGANTPEGLFTRLTVRTRQRGEVHRCPPRFGHRQPS